MNDPSAAGPLLSEPLDIFMFLMAISGSLMALSQWSPLKKFFGFVPPLVFCYFIPMIATTVGITPAESPLYGWCNNVFLPALLLLLLISADMGMIARLGPKAVGVMLAGTAGMVIGGLLGFLLLRGALPDGAWQNVGAITASWTGGSANMLAVKGALGIPDALFAPVILLDPIVAYTWMGLLFILAGAQRRYEARFPVDERLMADLRERIAHMEAEETRRVPITTEAFLVILALGLVLGHLCRVGGKWLHGLEPVAAARKAVPVLELFSSSTLMVILVTALGITLSLIPAVRKLEDYGASRIGYGLLYLLLPTFGAQAHLGHLGSIPIYGVLALIMLSVHAVFLFGAMLLFRAPLFFGATASQANVGGPASASLVASAYEPSLAPVGVLLGILGGILGTYAGLATAYVCKLIAG